VYYSTAPMVAVLKWDVENGYTFKP